MGVIIYSVYVSNGMNRADQKAKEKCKLPDWASPYLPHRALSSRTSCIIGQLLPGAAGPTHQICRPLSGPPHCKYRKSVHPSRGSLKPMYWNLCTELNNWETNSSNEHNWSSVAIHTCYSPVRLNFLPQFQSCAYKLFCSHCDVKSGWRYSCMWRYVMSM